MGKRWRSRQVVAEQLPSIPNPSPMNAIISHTIAPHKVIGSAPYYTRKQTMDKEQYAKYLVAAATRGYKIGAKMKTNYGVNAEITAVKPCADTMDIWGDINMPDCFLITREDTKCQGNIGYNEAEITLI